MGDGNLLSRNSSCDFGGDTIKVSIKRPGHFSDLITSVQLIFFPYIPNQLTRNEPLYFENITLVKSFNETGFVDFSISVIPEYSYKVSGAYHSPVGSLHQSRNITLQGETERMMNKIGCYIRNDFYFIKDNATADNAFFDKKSEIHCAESCHKAPECTFGWRYQLASKLCIFMHNVIISDLKPEMPVLKNARMLGLASGLKACSEPGNVAYKDLLMIIYLFDIEALNGGWGSWKSNTTGNCTVKTRVCDNPVQCGDGSSCRGQSVEKIGCNGQYINLATRIHVSLFR